MDSCRKFAYCWLALLCVIMAGCTISSTPGTKTPVSISILPTNPTLPLGLSQSFLAIAQLHDGTSQDVTSLTQWTSTNTAVATIDAKGNLKTVAPGTTTINAAYASYQASTGVTVTPPAVIAVNISPANPNPIQVGTSQPFTATGTMSNGGTPPDITDKVTWASSNNSVASVTSGGVATGDAVGVTLISATYGTDQNAPAGFVTLVVNPLLTSIQVIPSTVNIAENTNQQFTAVGIYNDGSTQDITAQGLTQWSLSSCTGTGVASVNAGLVKSASKAGSCTVTATSGSMNNSAKLTVSAFNLGSLAVTPAVPSVPIGIPIQFHATGQFAGGSVQDLTSAPEITWTSSNHAVAKDPNAGITTTLATGTTTITASFGTTTAQTTLTVTSAKLSSISVTAPAKLGEGTTAQLTATGKFSDGSTQDLTHAVTWKSSGRSVVVSATGLATANVPGSATVTASLDGVSGMSPALQVNPETIKSIAITPPGGTIAASTTQPFTATVTFSDNTQQDITSLVQWSSSNPAAATIQDFGTGAGLAAGIGVGTSSISAVFGSVNASSFTLTVSGSTPTSLALSPSNPVLIPSKNQASQQMKAIATFQDGSTQDVTSLATWSSSNITVAVVDKDGRVVAAASGGNATATITAAFGSASSQMTVTVQ